jgi:hypothetical protein
MKHGIEKYSWVFNRVSTRCSGLNNFIFLDQGIFLEKIVFNSINI